MKSKKGKNGWVAIKVDLQKAYDKIKWDFVTNTLHDIGFPYEFINLVRC